MNLISHILYLMMPPLLQTKFSPPLMGIKYAYLLGGASFTIPYFLDTVTNSSSGHQLSTQANNNVWIIYIN